MDIHGNLDYLKYFINTGVGFPQQKILNSCIILCGDVGLGFTPELENMNISFLNKLCEKTNNYIIAIRGNHKLYIVVFLFVINNSHICTI